MADPSRFVRAVRAFTPRTGALYGASAAVAYVAGATIFEFVAGRPNVNQAPGLVFAVVILGVGLGLMGAIAGFVVQLAARRSGNAGPADRRYVFAALAFVVVSSAVFGIQAVRQFEERSRPRVIVSTGAVVRDETPIADGVLAGIVAGQVVHGVAADAPFTWNSAQTDVSVEAGILTVRRGDHTVGTEDLRGLDYVREVVAATATLDAGGEYLALLVRLRATGRRELLLIYHSDGVLVHKELFARTESNPTPALGVIAAAGGRQEFVVNLGARIRFRGAS